VSNQPDVAIDKHDSKELQMKFDIPNFNKPWKISLEDHYQTPDTVESAARYATANKEAWQMSSNGGIGRAGSQ
jgi:hypothetical protein